MKKKLTISDLDGFEDICNVNELALTAGDTECKGPADNKTWYETESEKQLENWLDTHGPNAPSGSKQI